MEQPKVIVATCLHGRSDTFNYCYSKIDVDIVAVYSDESDKENAKDIVKHLFQFPNKPLGAKWNHLIYKLKDIDFDYVILLGQDDYFDDSFKKFVLDNCTKFDMMAFNDLYFEENGGKYYWGGYRGDRLGEPAGS